MEGRTWRGKKLKFLDSRFHDCISYTRFRLWDKLQLFWNLESVIKSFYMVKSSIRHRYPQANNSQQNFFDQDAGSNFWLVLMISKWNSFLLGGVLIQALAEKNYSTHVLLNVLVVFKSRVQSLSGRRLVLFGSWISITR